MAKDNPSAVQLKQY